MKTEQMHITDEQFDVLRRIAERGLEQAQIAVFTIHDEFDAKRQENYGRNVDAWQHMLDELLRIKAKHSQSIRDAYFEWMRNRKPE
jgi:hypothetical protein